MVKLNGSLKLYICARSFMWMTSSFLLLVFGMWVKSLTGSNSLAGLATLFAIAPRLLGAFGGSILDSLPRKPTLVISSLLSGGAVLLLLLVDGPEDLWLIWFVSLLYGVLGVFVMTAAAGSLKQLASDEELPLAMSIINGCAGVFQMLGPVFGAAVFAAAGPHSVALLVAGLCLSAGVVGSLVRMPPGVAQREGGILAGVRFLFRDRVLTMAILAMFILQMSIGFVDGSLYALVDALDAPPEYAGVVVGIQGAGAIIGGFASFWVVRRISESRGMVLGLTGAAVSLLAIIAVVDIRFLALCFVAVGGLLYALVLTSFNILFQRLTPEPVIGRAQAALGALQSVPLVASVGLGAALISVVDFRVLYGTTAGCALLAALFLHISLRSRSPSTQSAESAPARL